MRKFLIFLSTVALSLIGLYFLKPSADVIPLDIGISCFILAGMIYREMFIEETGGRND